MTCEEIRFAAALYAAAKREVTVELKPVETGEIPPIAGTCTFAGDNTFRVDTPQAAIFLKYHEVQSINPGV